MTNKIILSVIITAHNEGKNIHKTMTSVLDALKHFPANYEIIIHIDNGSLETIRACEQYKKNASIRIFKNHFGNTSESRNFAISQALGHYTAISDGDDLISPNWYSVAYHTIVSSHHDAIVHPSVVITFGKNKPINIFYHKDAITKSQAALTLIGYNCWCSAILARTSTLRSHPYRKLSNGYGFEDYVFNIDTTNHNILPIVAPKTILFYRQSPNSVSTNDANQNSITPYTDLFNFQKIKKIPKKQKQNRTNSKNSFEYLSQKILHRINPTIPLFIRKSFHRIGKIEPLLSPTKHLINSIAIHGTEGQTKIGEIFYDIAQNITIQPKQIFIISHINPKSIQIIDNFRTAHPSFPITIITTASNNNIISPKHKLPTKNTNLIQLAQYLNNLSPAEQDRLFSVIITQLNCQNIHIFKSQLGRQWTQQHPQLINHFYKVHFG